MSNALLSVIIRDTKYVAGQKTAEAKGLKIDVRGRQEEIAYLRESLTRTRDDLDQQRRLNKCLQERKVRLMCTIVKLWVAYSNIQTQPRQNYPR